MNLPNKLTTLRMLLIPVFIACFYLPFPGRYWVCALVFVLAYITDILDGQLARRRNIVTDYGKLMDPIADKLLTSSALIMLVAEGLLSPIPTIIIIGREFLISGFRLVAAGRGNVIAANWLGKVKTVTQCVAIVLLLVWPYIAPGGFPLDQITVWVSVFFTVWSGLDYLLKNKGMISH